MTYSPMLLYLSSIRLADMSIVIWINHDGRGTVDDRSILDLRDYGPIGAQTDCAMAMVCARLGSKSTRFPTLPGGCHCIYALGAIIVL